MHLREFQELMKDLYYARDAERGSEKTLLWLVEEMGEFAEAVRKKDREAVREELADIVAWTASLANIHGVDLERALAEKYPGHCKYCGSNPCICRK